MRYYRSVLLRGIEILHHGVNQREIPRSGIGHQATLVLHHQRLESAVAWIAESRFVGVQNAVGLKRAHVSRNGATTVLGKRQQERHHTHN